MEMEGVFVIDVSSSAIVYSRAATLGIVAGMRSQLPLALLALEANQGKFAADARPPWSLLRSRAALLGLGFSAIGELIVDKLPFVPSRIDAGPLAGRVVVGGVVGAALSADAGHSGPVGGLVGAVSAGLGTVGAYHARLALGRATPVPDPVWGAVEDALAITLGLLAIREGAI
jgi:uncharacterized membrane protein